MPDDADSRIDLAATLLRLMDFQTRDSAYYQLRTRMVALVQTLPPDQGRLVDLGALVANELTDRGRLREALPWLDQHVKHLESLRARTQPGRTLAAMNRAVRAMYVTRAILLDELREYARALAAWDEVLALGEVPHGTHSTAHVRVLRALTLVHQGNHTQAVREVEQTLGPTVQKGQVLYIGAMVCSLAATLARQDAHRSPTEQVLLEAQYGARAIEFLRRAQAAGYFAKPDGVDLLQTDPNLAAVRGRDDFQTLLAEVTAKAKPIP